MKCPFCGQDNTRVVDSRPVEENNAIRRRRMCDVCGKRFTTYEKIETIAKEIYGADGVDFTKEARNAIDGFIKLGADKMPVCMAKTQYSLSDNPKLLGKPENFRITVSSASLSNGAGFIVCQTGSIMTMPGLSKSPAAYRIDIDENGNTVGLF